MTDLVNQSCQKKVFLSHASKDDKPFVKRLHDDLVNLGFTVWFDRKSLMSRGLPLHQEIKDAIRTEVDRVVYVHGPKAARSPNVCEEWQIALEFDHVVVIPILRLGSYKTIPGGLIPYYNRDFRDFRKKGKYRYKEVLEYLVRDLREPNPKLGALLRVPSLPVHFQARPDLTQCVRNTLLVDLHDPQVVTGAHARVGIQGMGGIGKSVLAAALARDRKIRRSYPDGVFWISCGQNVSRDDLLQHQRDLVRHLEGNTGFDSLPQGLGILRELLAAKAVLIVLDNLWKASDAQAFDVLGPRCRMLVTTRDAGILRALDSQSVSISLFTEPEALQLLGETAGITHCALPPEALEVVKECGCLALALALSGGMARKGHTWRDIVEAFREADLEWSENREALEQHHRTIGNAMKVSYDALPEVEKPRFAELAVFLRDQTVPEAAAATLWEQTGNLSIRNCSKLLINLFERSLIQLDEKTDDDGKFHRRFRLHDLLYDYATRLTTEPKALHRSLLDAYGTECTDGWPSGPNDGYFFESLVRHLIEAREWTEVEALITNFSWLMRKCEINLLDSISQDYRVVTERGAADTIKRLDIWQAFFGERAHMLRRGNKEWPAHKILLQLAIEHADDSPLTAGGEDWLAESRCDWLWLHRVPRLPHAQKNSCLAVLEGHTHEVAGALALRDGRLLSWSLDKTMRIWDGQSGACLRVLEGHTDRVEGALALPEGRLLSWSLDKTMRTWDGQSGACLRVLEGHTDWIQGALALGDGRLFSWSRDNTLRIWDSQSGGCLKLLEGHNHSVNGALARVDGRLLSWSVDGTLRLWDRNSGACLAVLEGHISSVLTALALTDGRLLSCSQDKTLRLWDGRSGACLTVLKGHTGIVRGALPTPDGRLLSWSMDGTLRIWDSQSGACIIVLEGHTHWVEGALALADGQLLSWSRDNTLRLWNGQSGACLKVLEGHASSVDGALALGDGRLVSWSAEYGLRLWDGQSGACLKTLIGHTFCVKNALALGDGRLLSWSGDSTLRLWDCQSEAVQMALERHTSWVSGALTLDKGRLLSWSSDKTLRLWDCESGACLRVLEGHTSWVRGALALDKGRLLSWSSDKSLRLWDSQTGTCLKVLEGLVEGVRDALVMGDGRLLYWLWFGDFTLRLWDSQNNGGHTILEGHTNEVHGALALADKRLISWSLDKTLRLWNAKSGACLNVLQGHTSSVSGALVLVDGHLLSWSEDGTLRLWDDHSGACLTVFRGHTASVNGALELGNGRLLSWSEDKTLRLWNRKSGECLRIFEGHVFKVEGAVALANDRLLSWTSSGTLRLWDGQSGVCLMMESEEQAAKQHSDWIHAQSKAKNRDSVVGDFFISSSTLSAHLANRNIPHSLIRWHADSDAQALCLLPDGTTVVSPSGQVCFLKLYHGNRRISLAEAESKLPPPVVTPKMTPKS